MDRATRHARDKLARDSRTYPNVVFQLDSPRGIELDVLQSLANHIVGLALACLGGLDGGGLVDVPLVVDVELTEGVGEREDVILLELRKFPGQGVSLEVSRAQALCRAAEHVVLPLNLEDVHGCASSQLPLASEL